MTFAVAHGWIHAMLHVTVILNILPSFPLAVFAVGHLLQLALVTTSPSLPYPYAAHLFETWNRSSCIKAAMLSYKSCFIKSKQPLLRHENTTVTNK